MGNVLTKEEIKIRKEVLKDIKKVADKHGYDLFRTVASKHFYEVRQQKQLEKDIEEKKKELEELKSKKQ